MNSESMKIRAVEQLKNAVKTMRQACDAAERDLTTGDSSACQRVLHSFAWGFANASSSIESAMACVEDVHLIDAMNTSTPIETKISQ